MCFCPTLGLKILLLVLIPLTAAFTAAELSANIAIWNEFIGYQHTILITCSSLCVFIFVALALLTYATIFTKVRVLYAVLFIFSVNVLVKLVILFVCITLEPNSEKSVATPWLVAAWFFSFFCMVSIACYCIRLHDLANEE